jgi:hypothetical protein
MLMVRLICVAAYPGFRSAPSIRGLEAQTAFQAASHGTAPADAQKRARCDAATAISRRTHVTSNQSLATKNR